MPLHLRGGTLQVLDAPVEFDRLFVAPFACKPVAHSDGDLRCLVGVGVVLDKGLAPGDGLRIVHCKPDGDEPVACVAQGLLVGVREFPEELLQDAHCRIKAVGALGDCAGVGFEVCLCGSLRDGAVPGDFQERRNRLVVVCGC